MKEKPLTRGSLSNVSFQQLISALRNTLHDHGIPRVDSYRMGDRNHRLAWLFANDTFERLKMEIANWQEGETFNLIRQEWSMVMVDDIPDVTKRFTCAFACVTTTANMLKNGVLKFDGRENIYLGKEVSPEDTDKFKHVQAMFSNNKAS